MASYRFPLGEIIVKTVTICAALAAALLALPLVAELSMAASNKSNSTVRDRMSSEQKSKLRKAATEYCKKKYGRVHHIEIRSNGQAFCWTYPPGM
jgi:hypothetical protein